MMNRCQIRWADLNRVSTVKGKEPCLCRRSCLGYGPLAESLKITPINSRPGFLRLMHRPRRSLALNRRLVRLSISLYCFYINFPFHLELLRYTPRGSPFLNVTNISLLLLVHPRIRYKHTRVKMQFNIAALATAAMALLIAQAAAQSNDQECCASTYYIHTAHQPYLSLLAYGTMILSDYKV